MKSGDKMQIKQIIIDITKLAAIIKANPLYEERELQAELERLHLAQEIQLLPADDPLSVTALDWNFEAFGQRVYFVKLID